MDVSETVRMIREVGAPSFLLGCLGVAIVIIARAIGPKLSKYFDVAIATQESNAKALDQMGAAIGEKMSPVGDLKYEHHLFSNVQVKKALEKAADAAESALNHASPQMRQEVLPHVEAMREAVERR